MTTIRTVAVLGAGQMGSGIAQVVAAGGDTVEFIARYRGPTGRGFQREVSRFAQRAGRWFYVDGTAS